MAESTPGNLGAMFGGFMSGRAAGNRRLDQSVDRLESSINKFTDTLDRLTGNLGAAAGRAGGGSYGSPTQAAGRANGGGATFGGAHKEGADNSTDHRAPGAAQILPMGGGSHRAPGRAEGPMPTFGQIAKGAGGAAFAANAIYTANHSSGQVTGQTMASMYGGGDNWMSRYQSGMTGNYTAHGSADHWASMAQMQQRSGLTTGSGAFNQARTSMMSMSAVNPTISNVQAVTAMQSLSTTGSYNKMAALGINPLGAGGQGDPRSVARQILQRMGSQAVKTRGQADAAFGTSGSATLTLDSYIANGFLPPESRAAVESEMRNILYAQVSGMNYSQYNKAARSANTSTSARHSLSAHGIASSSLVQEQYRTEGQSRQSEAKTIGGFDDGVRSATKAVTAFRDVLNSVLGVGPIGELAGMSSGITMKLPGIGSLLAKFGGGGMAQGGVLPGYTPGKDVHKFYSPTGGRLDLSGGEGILIPQATKALGGAQGIKAINDTFRGQAFAGGGVFMGGTSPTHASQISQHKSGYSFAKWAGDFNDPGQGDYGDPVYAWKSGTVASVNYNGAGHQDGKSYGRWIVINHPGGQSSYYAHLSAANVKAGQRIKAGQTIGKVGDFGNTSGAHLHFEVRGGRAPLGGSSGTGSSGTPSTTGGTPSSGRDTPGGMGSSPVASGISMGAQGIGGFSEVAALGLGSGGSGAGGVFSDNGGENGAGGGVGIGGGSQGGPGNLSIGSLNMRFNNSPKQWAQDLSRAFGKVGVLGLQESRGLSPKWFKDHGMGYYTNSMGDTGVAWNSGRYKVLQKHMLNLTDSAKYGGGHLRSGSAYVLLQDKNTGTKFWVISNHPQAHRGKIAGATGIQRRQMAEIGALYKRLRSTGLPVFNLGDFNNSNPMGAGAGGGVQIGRGIDHILSGGAHNTGSGSMGMNSDHPFVYGGYHIGGSGGGHSDPYRPGGGVEQWRDEVVTAMRKAGISPTRDNVDRTLMQMRTESSGNPTIVNTTDSNWKAGHPSVGLMQVIEGTFNQYAGPYRNTGPKKYGVSTNPIANIYASLKYAMSRYGSLKNAYQGHGYDIGEWNIRDDKDARVHKGEMIFPSKIADVIRDELSSPGIKGNLGRGTGGGMKITFESGAIQVNLGGNVSRQKATQAGQWVVDAIMDDKRMKDLAEGRT